MRVVVVGGGVVGLACGYELARGGAEVLVLERGRLGGGASRGNTGWVTPSFTYPLPAPGVIAEGLRGLLGGHGPLSIRPSADPTFVRWLWTFRKSCSRARWEHGVRALLALNARTLELLDRYRDEGLAFEQHATGLVVAARSAAGLEPYAELFRELAAVGYSGEIAALSADELVALEPSLAPSARARGLHAQLDRYVRPESLAAGLAGALVALGGAVREGVEVTAFARREGDEVVVHTRDEALACERAVLAAGPQSGPLLAALGVRMPLLGARGYSVTVAGAANRPHHALYLAEAKVGISAYEDAVRIAGVFELGRAGAALDRGRVAAMLRQTEAYFARWRPSSEPAELTWAGLRPMTADGLPLIGPAPANRGVLVATGHGMLGITLAPATAAVVATMVLEGRTPPEALAFAPGRPR